MARPTRALAGAILALGSITSGHPPIARAAPDSAPDVQGPASPGAGAAPALPAVDAAEDLGPVRPPDLSYGAAARLRWVTVPGWMLNLFTKHNVPLSSWATSLSFFRRKGNFDIVGSVVYQNMSPSDGNWLGRNSDPAQDTDLVQFRDLAFYGVDVSFIWHQRIRDWVGMHYGAGVGLAIVGGEILRTSDDLALCTADNAGDLSQCHPRGVTCTGSTCNEQQLKGLGPGMDTAATPHRFSEPNVPPVIPIVNVVVGVDFRLPRIRGWEATLEGGFYDAFFLGGSVAYTF